MKKILLLLLFPYFINKNNFAAEFTQDLNALINLQIRLMALAATSLNENNKSDDTLIKELNKEEWLVKKAKMSKTYHLKSKPQRNKIQKMKNYFPYQDTNHRKRK